MTWQCDRSYEVCCRRARDPACRAMRGAPPRLRRHLSQMEMVEEGKGANKRMAEGEAESPTASPASPVPSPLPEPAEFAPAECAEVGVPWRGVTPRRLERLPCGALLCASQGSVVHFVGDALVNAANRGCLGGGGVDGAVNEAGGRRLEEARHALPLVGPYTRCPTGQAKLTIGGALDVRFVIHAVGPDYRSYDEQQEADELLVSAYRSAMQLAAERQLKTVAFSLISASIFRGDKPLLELLRLSVRCVRQHAYAGLEEVHLVAFTAREIDALVDACTAEGGETEEAEPQAEGAELPEPLAAPEAPVAADE